MPWTTHGRVPQTASPWSAIHSAICSSRASAYDGAALRLYLDGAEVGADGGVPVTRGSIDWPEAAAFFMRLQTGL